MSQALARECREELGAEVHVGPRVDELVFDYPDLSVHLTLYQAEPLTEPRALEHSALEWLRRPSWRNMTSVRRTGASSRPCSSGSGNRNEKNAPARQAAQRPQTGE